MIMSRRRALVVIALGVSVLYYLSDFSKESSSPSEEVRREKIREWKRRNERRSFEDYLSKRAELIRQRLRRKQVPVVTKKMQWNRLTEIEPGVLEKRTFDKHIVFSKDSLKKQIEEYSKDSSEDYVKDIREGNDTLTILADDEGTSAEDREKKDRIAKLEEENQSAKIAPEFDSKAIADILQDKKIKVSYVILNDWTKFNWEKYSKGCPKNKYRIQLKELLEAWIKIAKKHDIRYCLTYGSLVGALRNRDVIPHDKNIDIYVIGSDYKQLVAAAQPRNFDANDGKIHLVLQEDYFRKQTNERIRKSCQGQIVDVDSAVDQCAFQEQGARLIQKNHHIDIYPLRLDNTVVEDPVRHVLFKRSHVLPFQSCEFIGLNTFCPNDGKRILSRYYEDKDPLRPLYKCDNGEWIDIDY